MLPGERSYRLLPWLVRALVPPNVIGSYLLLDGRAPTYAGRSDTDLRRRLVEHSADPRARYFAFAVHATVAQAFAAECAAFHALRGATRNLIHPALPTGQRAGCPFCARARLGVRAAQSVARRAG